MTKKPRAAYNARVKGELLCDCGNLLSRELDKTYKCTNKICPRYNQKYIAVIMPIAAMYLVEEPK